MFWQVPRCIWYSLIDLELTRKSVLHDSIISIRKVRKSIVIDFPRRLLVLVRIQSYCANLSVLPKIMAQKKAPLYGDAYDSLTMTLARSNVSSPSFVAVHKRTQVLPSAFLLRALKHFGNHGHVRLSVS